MSKLPHARREPVPTARAELDLAEQAGERFDEACDHARRRTEHGSIQLGPTVPVPMSRLLAGRLAWTREVRDAMGRGDLYYALEPSAGGAEIPLTDIARSRIVCDLPLPGPPRARLIAVGTTAGPPKGLRAFAEAVRSELGSDSD